MRILIIEDEPLAAKRLQQLIRIEIPAADIVAVIDSVKNAVEWLSSNNHPAIIFMDIQLADGLSFGIFEKITISSSVIFTTAFDHYAVKAFRVNGLDYLLKPVDPKELKVAIQKYFQVQSKNIDYTSIIESLAKTQTTYKERLLIKLGNKLLHVPTDKIAYAFSEDGTTFAVTTDNVTHLADYTLEHLHENLDPACFFRISRKAIIHIQSLVRSHAYFNSRLKLDLTPTPTFDAIVSREKVNDFKQWLDR